MDVQQILRWIVIAIVLMVMFSLLGVILKVGGALLGIAVKVLVVLFVIAVILRLFGAIFRRART
ncbi:MAG: hypothetical protein AAF730_17050 [Bacteroidota bacterium]